MDKSNSRDLNLSYFSDSEYKRLRNIRYRQWSHRLYFIALILARILEKSLDFIVLNLRDKNPKLYYIKSIDNSHYKRIQIEGNYRKLNKHSPSDFNFIKIAQDLHSRYPPPPLPGGLKTAQRKGTYKICCMGARNGAELIALNSSLEGVNFVRSLSNAETKLTIFGTDISPTAETFQNMYEHDFHEVLPPTLGPVDVIYSNSLDQSNDPRRALHAWVDSLLPGGLLYIQMSRGHGKQSLSMLDPFSIELEFFPFVFIQWIVGKAYVESIIFPDEFSKTEVIFVIKKSAIMG